MPLCLGIAIASGFPPSAGIITAIVGGLVVSRINGYFVTINGPAAGLSVVIYSAVQVLGEGDGRHTLAAIMLAGVFAGLHGGLEGGAVKRIFPGGGDALHGLSPCNLICYGASCCKRLSVWNTLTRCVA